jgi:hypothetical protein
MASKFKPGIPENFTFDVGPVSDLGDYLDEQGPKPPRRSGQAARPPATAATRPAAGERAPATRPAVPTPSGGPLPVAPPEPAAVGPQGELPRERPQRQKGPRREISMTPDTLRMSDELLSMIRSGSGQRDTAPNEMFHALVLLVYEAREELDLHTIPKRGRWGSPTARAYPLELKNAFLRALLRKYGEAENATALRYPVNTAA